jgi:hypothetical protein
MSLFGMTNAILKEALTFSDEEGDVKGGDVEERYVSELYDRFVRKIRDYKEELISFTENQYPQQQARHIDKRVINELLKYIALIEEPAAKSRSEKVLFVQSASFSETIDEFITQLEGLVDDLDLEDDGDLGEE